ncbi:MAG TPA: hypothetical protein VK794_14090 [Steroidobacteraceae bacterium]|jgi:hypothetical protein|nr:hypothetical protein [Steroidobacteraceae bacterium]
MTNPMDKELRAERAVDQALKGLPPRRAPSTLESRVIHELQRRAALPWWRVSFVHWPAAPRVAFVIICIALVAATILGGVSAFVGVGSLSEMAALVLSWAHPFLAVLSSAGGLAALLVHIIPPLWLYGGLALGIVLYVTLFGLGAAAYRTLYLQPSSAGDL